MGQSLNLIKDAVERTSTHSQDLLNEIPALKTSFADASTDLKRVVVEISATTTAIKNLSSTYREDLANDHTNASASASGKSNSF
jgi:ABC-type transporter Mla subunit MlaD